MTSRLLSAVPAMVVFVIAFVMRWPSCGESFWLDELHTAWVIDVNWADVQPRARIGNQQPLYFYAIWIWQRFTPESWITFYGIEAWLRLTSVLLTSVAAGWLCVLVRGWTSSTSGGVAAGLALVLESHALFFGTELRPYAFIILMAVIAIGLSYPKTAQVRRRDRWILHAIVMLAALTQVTSLLTLGWLLIWVIVRDWMVSWRTERHPRDFLKKHWLIALWCAGSVIWFVNHTSLWHVRHAWESFAKAGSPAEIWQLWPWTPLLVIPVLLLVPRRWIQREPVSFEIKSVAAMLAFVVIVSTIGGYCLSAFGDVPLWHRRYLIAGLPLLCGFFGLVVSTALATRWRVGIVSLACLFVMVSQQGTLLRIQRGESRLVRRSDDWRGAVNFLHKQQSAGEIVWIDAGLIEQSRCPTEVIESFNEAYFRFPVSGPYRLEGAVGVGRDALATWLKNEKVKFLLTRRSVSAVRSKMSEIEMRKFGNLMLLERKTDE